MQNRRKHEPITKKTPAPERPRASTVGSGKVPGSASSVFRSYDERLDDTRMVQTPEEDEAE